MLQKLDHINRLYCENRSEQSSQILSGANRTQTHSVYEQGDGYHGHDLY